MSDDFIKQLKNYTILCVEDEENTRKNLANTLNYYFKDVYEASDAREGFDNYEYFKPDIILSDIEMPDKNGIEMVREIRKNDSSTIIIMLTAYSSEEYLFDLINLNINHYILKPINSNNLLDGIIKSLGDKLNKNVQINEDFYYDIKKEEIFYKQEQLVLRKRQKDFLLLLCKNKTSTTKYDEIEDVLWTNKSMSQGALKTFIKELRQNLPKNLIQNVPQIGYILEPFSKN